MNQNLGQNINMGQNMNQNIGQNIGQNINSNSPSIYENLLYSNLMLTNWLGSVKSNNANLFENNMGNHTLTDQIIHKNNMERILQTEQQQKMYEMSRLPLQM